MIGKNTHRRPLNRSNPLLQTVIRLVRTALQQIAAALKIPAEAIQNFDEEQAVNVIANTFNERSLENAIASNCTFDFNPVEKMIELYERVLQQQKEIINKLERLIEKK